MPKNVDISNLLGDDHPTEKPRTRGRNTKKPPEKPATGKTPQARSTTSTRSKSSTPSKRHERRLSLPLTDDQDRTLKLARVEDDIDTTTRIRAMIEIWADDPKLRKRVDKLAAQRSAELVRNRPRKAES